MDSKPPVLLVRISVRPACCTCPCCARAHGHTSLSWRHIVTSATATTHCEKRAQLPNAMCPGGKTELCSVPFFYKHRQGRGTITCLLAKHIKSQENMNRITTHRVHEARYTETDHQPEKQESLERKNNIQLALRRHHGLAPLLGMPCPPCGPCQLGAHTPWRLPGKEQNFRGRARR